MRPLSRDCCAAARSRDPPAARADGSHGRAGRRRAWRTWHTWGDLQDEKNYVRTYVRTYGGTYVRTYARASGTYVRMHMRSYVGGLGEQKEVAQVGTLLTMSHAWSGTRKTEAHMYVRKLADSQLASFPG